MSAEATAPGPAGGRSPRRRKSPGGRSKSDRRLGYMLVAPVVLLLLLVTAYPLIYNLWNSFHTVNLGIANNPEPFVGLKNYAAMFKSPEWTDALWKTAAFTAVSVLLDTIAALGLALMLNRRFRGRGLLRAAILVPWAVPTVVSAELWKTMIEQRSGFIDYILGLHTAFLNGVWTSWASIVVADAWKNVPFMAIILLAGLQVIPSEVYEAAKMDGASGWQSFRRMTLPLLKPALSVALIFRTLQAFLVFDVIYILTGGAPGTSTQTLSYLDWRTFLIDTNFGYGGAMSIVLVLMALVIAGLYVRFLRPET